MTVIVTKVAGIKSWSYPEFFGDNVEDVFKNCDVPFGEYPTEKGEFTFRSVIEKHFWNHYANEQNQIIGLA